MALVLLSNVMFKRAQKSESVGVWWVYNVIFKRVRKSVPVDVGCICAQVVGFPPVATRLDPVWRTADTPPPLPALWLTTRKIG